MQESSSTIISDTSILIILTRINKLGLLHEIYGSITVTNEVSGEFGLPLPKWISIENPSEDYRNNSLLKLLDPGEASSIALALEHKNSLLIIDEAPARKVAIGLNLHVTGTLGILLEAKRKNILTSLKPMLENLKKEGFRISTALESEFLSLANE